MAINDFKIKNRTSVVSPEKTAARIEEILAKAGASDIRKQYEGGTLRGIDFAIPTEFGTMSFRLPVNLEAAETVLVADARKRKALTFRQREAVNEQSRRTAWKMAQEWLEIQLSMVVMQQAELVQVLLPYAVNRNNQTMFEVMKQGGYNALLSAPKDPEAEEIIDALEQDLQQ